MLTPPPPPPPPHLLLLSYPAQGHTIPLLHLANLLASHGVAVTYVCVEHRIAQLRLRYPASHPIHPLVRLVGLPERVPAYEVGVDEGAGSLLRLMKEAALMENDFVQLVNRLQSPHHAADHAKAAQQLHLVGLSAEQNSPHQNSFTGAPIAVVYDCFCWWMLDAALALRLKAYPFFPSPATMLSVLLHLPLLIIQGYVPLRMSAQPKLVANVVPGLVPFWDKDLLYFLRDSAPQEALQYVMTCGFALMRASNVLINTCYELEATTIDSLRSSYQNAHQTNIKVSAVGPLRPLQLQDGNDAENSSLGRANLKEKEKECLKWLDSRSPASVLYVCFGSIYIPSLDGITELAYGLEASSHSFLWVLRPPPGIASKDDSFSFSSLLPEGFEARTKERGFIISPWAPQLSILSHPSIGAFLTHCGWNSTLESISTAGVPLITFPQFADQRLNRRMIVDQWKVGVQLETDENMKLHREEIDRVIRTVMDSEEGEQLKQNAKKLRNIMIKSRKEGGSSFKDFQGFVEELFTLSSEKYGANYKEETGTSHVFSANYLQ